MDIDAIKAQLEQLKQEKPAAYLQFVKELKDTLVDLNSELRDAKEKLG